MHAVVLLFIVVVSFISAAPAQAQNSRLVLQPCTIAEVARPAQCGRVGVLENRRVAKGRRIELYVVVVKAERPGDALPVLFFAGGPGQGAASLAAAIMRDLAAITPDRDVIFIDQRGTGQSQLLTCKDGFLALDRSRLDDFRQCRDALAGMADLSQYGTDQSADDAAEVMRALGRPRVDVVAASYGTRLALRFMRRHAAMVNAAVLRAVAPQPFNIIADGARYSRQALARVFADCRADAACHAAFPDVEKEFAELRARLRDTPSPISVDRFDQVVYALLLSTPTRQMLPWLIHRSVASQGAPLAGVSEMIDATYKTVAAGSYLSVVCGEDAPFVHDADVRDGEFGAATAAVLDACKTWPVKRVAPPPAARVSQPTLVVSGELDPAMPPAVGEQALRELSRGTHIIAPATAHGPMFPGCVAGLVRQFLANSQARLDASCTTALTTPPFRVQ